MVSTKYALPSAVPETEMIPIQFRKKTRQMKLYHVMSNIGMEKLLVELPFQDLDMMVIGIALFFTSIIFSHFARTFHQEIFPIFRNIQMANFRLR